MGATLSIWLAEASIERSVIGFFSLLHIPFSLKILWTPIIDLVSIPFFEDKPRKGWVIISLLGMALSLLGISFVELPDDIALLIVCLLSLSLFTGCLYITGLAYELESIEKSDYGSGSAYVITGYRLGLLCAGGGALYLSYLWDWPSMFRCMAALLALGGCVILLQPEPFDSQEIIREKRKQFSKHVSLFKGFWHEVIYQPCCVFFQRSEWIAILAFLLLFKFGDQMVRSMEGPFYLSLGFNKADLATASKIWGMLATISGAFFVGFFLKDKNPFSIIGCVGFIHACAMFCYAMLSLIGKSFLGLYVTVALEHFTGGMAMTIFIYFLWKVCDRQYAAVQYALLWSLFSFKADIIGSCGGILAASCSWTTFFFTIAGISTASSLVAWMLVRNIEKLSDQCPA